MGGLTEPIARVAGEALDKAYSKLSESDPGRRAIDFVWSMGRSFMNDPRGATVQNMLEQGVMTRNQVHEQMRAPLNKFEEVTRKDNQLATMHDYKKTSVEQIYHSLPQGHAGRNALDPLMSDEATRGQTIPELRGYFAAQANMHGREAALGKDSYKLSTTLYPMLTGASATDRTKAEAWLGIISQVFKDTSNIPNFGEGSQIKRDVVKNINRVQKEWELDPIKMDVRPEYKPGGKLEAFAHKYAMNYLAPFIAIAHMKDFTKLGTVPAQALWRTLESMGDTDIEDLKSASGIFHHTMHSILDNDFDYRTGML